MSKMFSQYCEAIDASVFSSDRLSDPQARRHFKQYVSRWQRQIEIEENNQGHELLLALQNANKLLTILMPGVAGLVIQDFAFVNNTLLQTTAAIHRAGGIA